MENWAFFKKKCYICNQVYDTAGLRGPAPERVSGCSVRNLAKGILPKVLNFEIAKTVENKRTIDEECPSSVSYMPGRGLSIYRYGRGVNLFRSCLLWCLAIPEIEGRDATASRLSRIMPCHNLTI